MGAQQQWACALALCCVAVAAAIPLPARKPLPHETGAPLVEVVTLHEALCPGLCSRSQTHECFGCGFLKIRSLQKRDKLFIQVVVHF